MSGDVDRRAIVTPEDSERTAVLLVPVPAGATLEFERTWRFAGWLESTIEREHIAELTVKVPGRIHLVGE